MEQSHFYFTLGSKLTDNVMEKVLSGCPNLECLEMDNVSGIHSLEISNLKLIKLIIKENYNQNHPWLEIIAPYIQKLELWGDCGEIRIRQRNVPSLITAVLDLTFCDNEGDLENECRYLKELLHGVAHVENLELGSWCIECLSILEFKGWQFPPSSRKFLELDASLEEFDFPGICSFLQSSLDLETLVIDWYYSKQDDLLSRYTDVYEQSQRFETHNFNSSFLYLKTIEIINFPGPLCENKFVLPLLKYLLKHATVLEKLVIVAKLEGSDVSGDYAKSEGSDVSGDYAKSEGSDVSEDYVKVDRELLSFPRSSPQASVVFSYV